MDSVREIALQFRRVGALLEDPVLVLAVVGVVLLVLLIGWAVRRVRLPPGERLRRVLADKNEIAVVMHPDPDPDAMSAALAVDRLAASVDTGSTMQYSGQIRHQENRAFEAVLDTEFDRFESSSELAADAVVLVDHNKPRGFTGAESVDPVAVIDHHPGDGTGTEFTDVRRDVGACASIFAGYFREMGWDLVDSDDEHPARNGADVLGPRVSTGLVYGIQSDTKSLTKGCSSAEFEAAEYLFPGVDQDQLYRIANPQVEAEVLEVKATAITDREVQSPFAVSDVGRISNADAIPQAADELLRLEGITAVVVLGDNNGTIHLSGRSRDDRVHMGKTLRAVVDDIPMAGAGGHARMGGGQISADHMQGLDPTDGTSREQFRQRLFDAMGGDI
jgi:nanoRNase/pAp phosphatase (c-di-AMP/oligoRNAs hydrolase)